jgi:hypothetical protein
VSDTPDDAAPRTPPGNRTSELMLAEGAERVTVPFAGKEYICPACEEPIPNRRIIYLGKPAKYAHVLNDVLKCPRSVCRFIFSPRSDAIVVRE